MAEEEAGMATTNGVEFRYAPRYCALLRKHVWAIMTHQADGTWRIVNCLDKDEGCFSLECAFTTSGGEWPYATTTADTEQTAS